MISPIIQTEQCTLRPFRKEDALLWQAWDIDPEIQAHMPEPKNEPQDIGEQYDYMQECEDDKEGYYWSIETKDGTAIGTVSLFDINPHHKVAGLGIVIGDKNYQGKGMATDVIRSLVERSFQGFGIEYIGAEVEEGNVPMQKVFEKAGFVQDGLFKGARAKAGKRIDVLHFSIVK